MNVHTLNPALHLHISAPICTSPSPIHCPHDGQVSLSDNVADVPPPKHRLFSMPPCQFCGG